MVAEPNIFSLTYRTWAAMRRDCEQQLRHRGLFVKTPTLLSQFSKVKIRLLLPDQQAFELAAEVVQALAQKGVAVQFGPGDSSVLDRIKALCLEHASERIEAAPNDDPQVSSGGPQDKVVSGEDSLSDSEDPEGDEDQAGSSGGAAGPADQLSVNEKRQMALHGQRETRLQMIRDRNKMIHPFVLKNPAITLDEIEQIAKMPSVNPEVLRMIASNMEWNRSASVCRNLVHNPKTPMREALQMLNKLPLGEIRALAKSGNVRTAIQQAARKIVVG